MIDFSRAGTWRHAGLALLLGLSSPLGFSQENKDKPAPEIMGKTLEGGLFKLSSLRGQPVVLNFFSVTCIPCREEMPELAAKAQTYGKVRFVSVHVDDHEPATVAEFVKKLKAAPPTIVLASQRVQQVYRTDKRGLPETHLIDRQGRIVQTLNGYNPTTMGALKDWLDKTE